MDRKCDGSYEPFSADGGGEGRVGDIHRDAPLPQPSLGEKRVRRDRAAENNDRMMRHCGSRRREIASRGGESATSVEADYVCEGRRKRTRKGGGIGGEDIGGFAGADDECGGGRYPAKASAGAAALESLPAPSAGSDGVAASPPALAVAAADIDEETLYPTPPTPESVGGCGGRGAGGTRPAPVELMRLILDVEDHDAAVPWRMDFGRRGGPPLVVAAMSSKPRAGGHRRLRSPRFPADSGSDDAVGHGSGAAQRAAGQAEGAGGAEGAEAEAEMEAEADSSLTSGGNAPVAASRRVSGSSWSAASDRALSTDRAMSVRSAPSARLAGSDSSPPASAKYRCRSRCGGIDDDDVSAGANVGSARWL